MPGIPYFRTEGVQEIQAAIAFSVCRAWAAWGYGLGFKV